MLDADEELPPEQHETLRKLLRSAPVISWRLPLQDVGREAEGVSYVPRLFRNAPALFFVGRVHEQVFTSIEVRRQEWGLETRLGDAMLRHYGYTKELTHERDKVGRNLRLLEKAVLETPGEANLLMNYGLELTRSGRPEEGLRQYRAAFEDMADEPTEVVVPETREMLLGQFCTQLMAAKAHAEIIRVLTSPLAKLGVGLTASLHFTLGLAQMELKEFALAAEQFRQCLAKRERPALTPVNVEIRKAGPRHCLALCLAQTNEPVAAESEFQAARQDDAESAPVAADYARFLQEKGRAVEGLQLLHQFTSEHPQAAVAWQVGGAIALSQPEFLEVAVDWTAEALRHFPEDAGIQSQRAEALLLAGQPEAALPLWQKFKASEQPVALAALILCETAVGKNEYAPSPELAGAVTQEFVNCYRRLLVCGAEPVVRRVNAGVDGLARVLPRAAELLRAVISEANAPGA
jgi:tetratricopeptide (TPR) repeat protein